MSKLFVLAFVFCFSIGSISAHNCGVDNVARKVFTVYDDVRTGNDAKTACEEKGVTLAMPKDQEQVEFLHSLDSSKMWIGGTKESGEWMWVDGTAMPTDIGGTPWYGGVGPSGNGKCLQVGWEGAVWDDVDCSPNKKYACEVNLDNGHWGWQFVGDRLVKKYDTAYDFEAAKQLCIQDGGYLITDDNPEIHEWLSVVPNQYWIGASDLAEEGNWLWHDGAAVTEGHWSGGAPDNRYRGENCAVVTPMSGGPGKWDDVFCGNSNFVACEKRVNLCQTKKESKRKLKSLWKH